MTQGALARIAALAACSAAMAAGLAACASTPLTSAGIANKALLESVAAQAADFGFGGGDLERRCAALSDCPPSQQFTYSAGVVDAKLTDEKACANFFALAQKLGFTTWALENGEKVAGDQTDAAAGQVQCVLTLGHDRGSGLGSEAIVAKATVSASGAAGRVSLSLSAQNVDSGERSYLLMAMSW